MLGNAYYQKARKLKRTVLIGLGGTGKKALLYTKKRFLETFGEEPPLVKYLLIDTTSANTDTLQACIPEEKKPVPVRLRANEILHIEARGASLLPQVHDEIREWFPPKADLKANILSGAGQIRALGRLALFANATTVYENLRDLLALARDYRDERPSGERRHIYEPYTPHLTVALVGSLAGGTGSGIFLDVAFLLRQLMKDEDQLFGYFLLPDIYVNRPGTQNVEANAYAALKELDHFMSLQGTFRYRFGGREIEVRKKPFDMVFLVNRENRAGKTFTEVEDLMELLGLGLYLLAGPLGKEQADTFDNIVHQLNEQKGKYYGKTAHYASFGAAELRFAPEGLLREARRKGQIKALEALLGPGYPWSISALEAKLEEVKTLSATEEASTLQLSSSPSREKDKEIWPGLKQDLESLRRNLRENLLRQYEESVGVRGLVLREAAEALAHKGTGFEGLEVGFKTLLQSARELHAQLSQEVQQEERDWKERLERTEKRVYTPLRRGLFGRGEEDSVLTKREVSSLGERAKQLGTLEARAAIAESWVKTLEGLLGELQGLMQQVRDHKAHLENEEGQKEGPSRDVAPFTLTLPPAYVEARGRVEAEAAEIRWDLESLLRAPKESLEQALALQESATSLAEWVQKAFQNKEEDRELWEAVGRTLRELDQVSDPAWDYEDAWVSNPGLGYKEKVHILGVADATDRNDPFVGEEEILNLFASNLHDRMRLQRVSTGDPHRVLHYKIEASIPAFVLRGIHIYREKYEKLSAERSFHIHRDFEGALEDLFPLPREEEAVEVWTKARAFGLLTNEAGYGFVDRRQGTERRHLLGTSPAEAFRALKGNFFAFKELEAQVKKRENELRRDPQRLKEIRERLAEIIANRESKLTDEGFDPEDKEVFQKELEALRAWKERLEAFRPDSGNDDFPALL
ncbi:tubulin-like doman-containing protein [Thermus thermophilus]|uniref:tubulin-like doman-containing protein n=1 Tax=Thermus thermophilus TaxID=274 RepID=UPI0023DEE6AE|nr:tubulin-like doman-containing protein [Thermus thermophilus]